MHVGPTAILSGFGELSPCWRMTHTVLLMTSVWYLSAFSLLEANVYSIHDGSLQSVVIAYNALADHAQHRNSYLLQHMNCDIA